MSTSFSPHLIISAFPSSVFLQFLPTAIIVSASSFSTFEFSGVLPFVSNITLIGFLICSVLSLIVRLGLSSITVPMPTKIASHSCLSSFTLSRSCELDNLICFLFGNAIFPSADIAQFMIILGFTLFYLECGLNKMGSYLFLSINTLHHYLENPVF